MKTAVTKQYETDIFLCDMCETPIEYAHLPTCEGCNRQVCNSHSQRRDWNPWNESMDDYWICDDCEAALLTAQKLLIELRRQIEQEESRIFREFKNRCAHNRQFQPRQISPPRCEP